MDDTLAQRTHSVWRPVMSIFRLSVASLVLSCLAGCSDLGSGGGKAQSTKPSSSNPVAQATAVSRTSGSQTDPAGQEKAKLQGTWSATDGEFQGVRMGQAALPDIKWTFTGDKVT